MFLDPMYPRGDRRALPQREMRVLRAAVGDDIDVDALFAADRKNRATLDTGACKAARPIAR